MVTSDISTVFLRGYLSYLRVRGWHVTIISSDDGRLREFADREEVSAIAVPMVRDPSPRRDLISFVRMISAIRRAGPDVLVYSTPKAALLASIAGAVNLTGVRIYSIWGLRHESMKGWRRFIMLTSERITASFSHEILSVSPSLAEQIALLGIPSRVRVLGYGSTAGVDVDYFDAGAQDIAPPDVETRQFLASIGQLPVVVFVGRVSRDKGVDVLIDALRLLEEEATPVAGLIVGPVEEGGLQDEIDLLPSTAAVHWVGAVADPRAYMLAGDALCLPSLREGFGQVVAEAACLGVPAIVSNATGVRDLVTDGETGFVVAASDARALADAIRRLVFDRSLAAVLGAAARAQSVARYDARRVWQLHDEHFSDAQCAREGK